MRWSIAIRQALGPGTLAALLSSAALIAMARRTPGQSRVASGVATHNGPSQWLYGKQAASRRRPDLRHTLPGYLIHHASSLWWAAILERLAGNRPERLRRSMLEGLAVAALASFVDYRLTPERLQPGFEKHISRRSLGVVYLLFGVGLGIGHYLQKKSPRSRRR